MRKTRLLAARACGFACIMLLVSGCATQRGRSPTELIGDFTFAVIPDTQNYLDHKHQRSRGFPIDAAGLFIAQMEYIKERLVCRGGDIAFVTSVGDVWQSRIDVSAVEGGTTHPARGREFGLAPEVAALEAPIAARGYSMIANEVPFAVAPGNHDYDWQWKSGDARRVGGLRNFSRVFGPDSPFFKGKKWYVGAHDNGGDSAQLFNAGGYRFLHLALQFEPSDASLMWAQAMLDRYRGLPTIITTHAYIDENGDHSGQSADSGDVNGGEGVWQKLVMPNDQVFMVLSGHHAGSARRVDQNLFGHQVHSLLADYQDRHQVAIDLGFSSKEAPPLGDGWLRLVHFDLDGAQPSLRVRTYSTHYKAFSSGLASYSDWYTRDTNKGRKPDLPDADEFTLPLGDFQKRFGRPKRALTVNAPEHC
jgi:hypothetical protein